MLQQAYEALDFLQIQKNLEKYCLSPLGKERIHALAPLSFQDLQEEFLLFKDFYHETQKKSFPAFSYPDIRPLLDLSLKSESMIDSLGFMQILAFLEEGQKMKEFFLDSLSPLLIQKGEAFFSSHLLIKRIKDIFDVEGQVKEGASAQLKIIREKMRTIRKQVEEKLKTLLLNPSLAPFFQEPVITMRDQRWVVPLKAGFKGKVKGLVIDVSHTGETLFIEPQGVVEDNNLFVELKGEEKSEIIKILKNLTRAIAQKKEELKSLFVLMAHAEFLYIKTAYGKELKATFPLLNQEGFYALYEARHPLIKNPVPIQLELGKEAQILVITGPNTGGKTATLKTLGLLSLMACCGLMISAKEGSQISYFDHIFAQIGDYQSIAQNLSTFSGNVVYLKAMFQKVSSSSLVLLDELGAGTNPDDGSALAVAILEELLLTKSKVVVTTHLEWVKNMAFSNPAIQNASVEFDLTTLTPLYGILQGVTGKSYALEIAHQLGLKKEVLERAKKLLQKEDQNLDVEKVLEKLNQDVKKAQEKKSHYHHLIQKLEKKELEILKKEEEVLKKEWQIKKEAHDELLKEIKKSRLELMHIMQESKKIKSLELLKEKAKELEKISHLAQDSKPAPLFKKFKDKETFAKKDKNKEEDSFKEINIGDWVKILTLGQEAKVLSINQEKKILTLLLGQIKIKAALSEVQKIKNKEEEKPSLKIAVKIDPSPAPFQINIIGKRRDEAMQEVEQYVYQLSLKKSEGGAIIHGKGAGILKQGVADFLKSCPFIEKYEVSLDGGATHFTLKS